MVTENSITYIAEIGLNHNGSIDLAKKHIEAAKIAGATVAKFQTYFSTKRANNDTFLYDLFRKYEFNADEFDMLKRFCEEIDIQFCSTAFCIDSAKLLAEIGCDHIKVSSFQHQHKEMLAYIITQPIFKTLYVSTGLSTKQDIINLSSDYDSIEQTRKPDIAILHCISSYPVTSPTDCNLQNIPFIKNITQKKVGYSDHTIGASVPPYAVAMGATVIEKHFTIDNQLEGPDHAMSASTEVFSEMVTQCEYAASLKGHIRGNTCYETELPCKKFISAN